MIAEHIFNDEITHICELNSVNRYANWQFAVQAQKDCRYILVATRSRIELIYVKRDINYGRLVVQETNLEAL